jgi:hypothetical protein
MYEHRQESSEGFSPAYEAIPMRAFLQKCDKSFKKELNEHQRKQYLEKMISDIYPLNLYKE